MSQFNFINELNNALTMDGEISGPAPRWKKKMESSTAVSLSSTLNTSRSILSMSFQKSVSITQKTPGKSSTSADAAAKSKKTPTPSKGSSSVSKSSSTNGNGGDRFIPNRATTNFELGHFLVKQEQNKADKENDNSDDNTTNPSQEDRQKVISDVMEIGDVKATRVLSYRGKAPSAPESHQNTLKVVYSVKTPASSKSGSRYIPTTSDRVLDAPEIINDYYLNLLDWSKDNIVTVALGNTVYLWNAATGKIEELVQYENEEHACALAWIQDGPILAIGNNAGAVELWDCTKVKRLRVMDGHAARVGSLAWNSYIVSSGSRDGSIIHHDVRVSDHKVGTLNGHTQEVCGLKWSNDFKYLASGGNDNLVNVWSSISGGVGTSDEPIHVLNQHQAAVRALAWCPWQGNILASGGGTADRCIKFWNVNNGTLINSVDSKSQVCALLWSRNYRELISAHGYANNQLTIWKYPSMIKEAELTGHTARVLQMAMSPDGSTVMSAGADETLRLWNCFEPDPHAAKKSTASSSKVKQSVFKQTLR